MCIRDSQVPQLSTAWVVQSKGIAHPWISHPTAPEDARGRTATHRRNRAGADRRPAVPARVSHAAREPTTRSADPGGPMPPNPNDAPSRDGRPATRRIAPASSRPRADDQPAARHHRVARHPGMPRRAPSSATPSAAPVGPIPPIPRGRADPRNRRGPTRRNDAPPGRSTPARGRPPRGHAPARRPPAAGASPPRRMRSAPPAHRRPTPTTRRSTARRPAAARPAEVVAEAVRPGAAGWSPWSRSRC